MIAERPSGLGRFWSDRYKSSVVEGRSQHDSKALATIAAYIDLNPVRAGIVKDPAAYRFCGYGAAMGGNKAALSGLFTHNRSLFSQKRKTGARTLRNADSGGLYCMRDLRRDPISPPACASG